MQRLTDQEIVDYLRDEKKLDIARSTVTTIKKKLEKEAAKWYVEQKDSRYKFVALYKERLDSLLTYQKILNTIVSDNLENKPDSAIRAIAELHRIEISIFNLWNKLPNINLNQESESIQETELPPPVL